MLRPYTLIKEVEYEGRKLEAGRTLHLDEQTATWLAQQGAIIKDGVQAQQPAAVAQAEQPRRVSGCGGCGW